MALDRISLTAFRNHPASSLDGTGRFNLLLGENGAGKTNVLEALSLLAPGRGLRRASLAELALHGAPGGFGVTAMLGDVALGTGTASATATRREVRINSAPAPATRLSEWLALAWLTPAMDRLWVEGGGGRRRFLDRMALALDPTHASHAVRYEQALRERNRLLGQDSPPDPAWLNGLEATLAESGAAIATGRAHLVARLGEALADEPDGIFARPALAYAAAIPAEPEALATALLRSRPADRAAGRTLVGPHRDDLAVTLAAKNMAAAECSTGEQKAMLIALVLAHAGLLERGRPLVLLLDEVAAHLDPLRREALFARLDATGRQVWLTGTEAAPFAALGDTARRYMVIDGRIGA